MDRVKEPSTWAGIAAILAALSPIPGALGNYCQIAAATAGAVAVALREGKQ